MDIFKFQISWIDLIVLTVLVVGIIRGRKRGMSEEVLDLMKWVLILITAGYIYQPVGDELAMMTPLSHLTCYVFVYGSVILTLHGFFAILRRAIGDKLVSSDAFGGGEYYLGMAAGLFRYMCVIIIALAFLNARQYTPEELAYDEAFQENNFGSIRLPTPKRMQRAVFENSLTGALARNYLSTYLIRPTTPEDKALGGGNSIHGRGRNLDEMLDKR